MGIREASAHAKIGTKIVFKSWDELMKGAKPKSSAGPRPPTVREAT